MSKQAAPEAPTPESVQFFEPNGSTSEEAEAYRKAWARWHPPVTREGPQAIL